LAIHISSQRLSPTIVAGLAFSEKNFPSLQKALHVLDINQKPLSTLIKSSVAVVSKKPLENTSDPLHHGL